MRGFLALSPDPVIIDIHRTPVGFKLAESLELLLSLMNTTLGGHFVHNRHGPHVTLDDLWQMGKRVIFTFMDPTVSDHTPWVWSPLPQAWANAQLLDDLKTFLDAEMNKRFESPRLWAAMAHLTPTVWDLLFRSHVGVRGMTDRVSFSITRWLRQRWGHMANIVASDFFRGNDIINVVIRYNTIFFKTNANFSLTLQITRFLSETVLRCLCSNLVNALILTLDALLTMHSYFFQFCCCLATVHRGRGGMYTGGRRYLQSYRTFVS